MAQCHVNYVHCVIVIMYITASTAVSGGLALLSNNGF